MVKFFRKIRQKLINEGNLKRYLIYSIGEILLVMIGILLALQVNNWNEKSKNRITEIQLLETISENLTNDLDDFERNLIHLSNRVQACEVLLNSSKNDIEYHDSLAYHLFYTIAFPHFTPNRSGYELLKSKGIEYISNDLLKLEITNLYEYGYKYLFTWESEQISEIVNTYSPMLRQYLGTTTIGDKHMPISLNNSRNHLTKYSSNGLIINIEDFAGLCKNVEIKSFIAQMKGSSKFLKQIHYQAQNDVINVIKNIEKDLDSKY